MSSQCYFGLPEEPLLKLKFDRLQPIQQIVFLIQFNTK